jgi:hypothetical protein
MTLFQSILIVIQMLPVPQIDKNEIDRELRLEKIAFAIARAAELATCKNEFSPGDCKPIATDENLVAAELVWQSNAETALRSNVHRDKCSRYQCDAVRIRTASGFTVIHLARGLWQPHKPPRWSILRWDAIRGDSLEATSNAAWEAAKMIEGYRGMCGSTTRGAFAGYATGGKCSHPQAAGRAQRTEWVRARIIALRSSDIGFRASAREEREEPEGE